MKIDLNDIGKLAEQSFPLCMRHAYSQLEKEHHLRHFGRLQLGLFFKGIGLTLDQSLQLWRREFLKNPAMDADKFDKSYAYNVRHAYGMEGARKNYSPYSCQKIITSNAPGPGDSHGCPFRHFDSAALKTSMLNYGVTYVEFISPIYC